MEERSYYIQGGIYPGALRATIVSTMSRTEDEGFKTVKQWAKREFADWNHMHPIQAKLLISKVRSTRI